eukprot:g6301.t1
MTTMESPPKAILKLSDKLSKLPSEESKKLACAHEPKSPDVFVVGVNKTGTTWVQHIMHGLRSNGNIDFNDIDAIVPCFEYLSMFGFKDLSTSQEYQPNMYKSHMRYDLVPKGKAKHIIIVRSPCDTAVSRFYHYEDWHFKKGEITLEEFIDWFYIKPCPPYQITYNSLELEFIAKAYPHRNDEGVLWLHYEDLKEDLKGCIKLMSEFLGIGVGNQELLNLIERQSRFDFMKKHKAKFSNTYFKKMTKTALGFKEDEEILGATIRVRNGEIGQGKQKISPKQLEAMNKRWIEIVKPICGLASYEEMRDSINAESGRFCKKT